MNELKPCPFCGGNATLKESKYGYGGAAVVIKCPRCHVHCICSDGMRQKPGISENGEFGLLTEEITLSKAAQLVTER